MSDEPNPEIPGDSLDWTPEMALDYAKKCLAEREYDACYVILLSREEGDYLTRFINSGLNSSECIALLEIQKARMTVDFLQRKGDEDEAV